MACTECRRRKLRCDEQQPQCSNCESTGLVCETSIRHARGPKRGHMAALRKRIAELEGRLASQKPGDRQEHEEAIENILDFSGNENITDWNDFENISLPTGNNTSVSETDNSFSNIIASTAGQSMPMTMASLTSTPVTTASLTASAYMPIAPLTPATTVSIASPQLHALSGFVPAEFYAEPIDHILIERDRDQLYFERIHSAVPLLHQRNYLSWSRKDSKKKSQSCLQYAMWALAALQSAQYRYLQETLYRSCTQMLTSICLSDAGQDPFDREQIQAWLLITVYELMRSFHRQAWMSVGRAFRLLQLLRYHELDNPALGIPAEEDFLEREEQRRAFWFAYFLDHLFGVSNNWPITLNELVVCTRLPAFEEDFQFERPVLGSFLSEAITEQTPRYPSAFNEVIIFATLCGRRLFYGQQVHVRSAYGDMYSNWTHSTLMLDNILRQRVDILSQCYPPLDEASGPMMHFVSTMAQCSIIYSCTGVDMMLRVEEGNAAMQTEYALRATVAAEHIITLAQMLTRCFIFKIHPLASIPLMLCAEFLFKNQNVSEKFAMLLERLLKVFEQIRDVEDPAQSYIDVMKRWQCSAKSGDRRQRQPSVDSSNLSV